MIGCCIAWASVTGSMSVEHNPPLDLPTAPLVASVPALVFAVAAATPGLPFVEADETLSLRPSLDGRRFFSSAESTGW